MKSTELSRQHIMLCFPKRALPHVPSNIRLCSRCTGEVWVSDASIKLAEEKNAIFICTECTAPDEILKSLEAAPSAGQQQEIDEVHRRRGL